MIQIQDIINNHRARLEAAGLLKKATAPDLSPRITALRPSLAKVGAALTERPDRFTIVQPSPFSLLFDLTLPQLEPLLLDLGEAQAERIISTLCEHGRSMIEQHGLAETQQHLEDFFQDLIYLEDRIRKPDGLIMHSEELFHETPLFEDGLSEPKGIKKLIHVYELKDFSRDSEPYLMIWLNGKLAQIKPYKSSKICVDLNNHAVDIDLERLTRTRDIGELDLYSTRVTDAGLRFVSQLVELEVLRLPKRITDNGLAQLSALAALQRLELPEAPISDAGLIQLVQLSSLQILTIGSCEITDTGLKTISKMASLRRLIITSTKVTAAGIEKLKEARPGLEIVNT